MTKRPVKSTKVKPGRPGANSNHSRNPRKERYDEERLGRVAERLREQAARLAALAEQMQVAAAGHVDVDGHAMLVRGLNQIDNFADNASRAIREANQAKQMI